MNSNINEYKSDTSSGFSVITENRAEVILVTESQRDDSVLPRIWVKSIPEDENRAYNEAYKVMEKATGEALQILAESPEPSPDIAEWCKTVYDTAVSVFTQIQKNNFDDTDITFGDYTFNVTPMKSSELSSMEDVEYYLIDDDIIEGSSDIFEIASKLVNYCGLVKENEQSKEALQIFYEEKIYPYQIDSSLKKPDGYKEDYGRFSDWHKEIYHRRPNNFTKNECFINVLEKEHEDDYRQLDRLKTDCEYFLGEGNCDESKLWAKSVKGQIEAMNKIMYKLPREPEWCTLEKIVEYDDAMRDALKEKDRKTKKQEGKDL